MSSNASAGINAIASAHPRRLLHAGLALLQPGSKTFRGLKRGLRLSYEFGVMLRQPVQEITVPADHTGRRRRPARLALVDAIRHLELPDGHTCQFPRRRGQVDARLLEDAGHRLELRAEPRERVALRGHARIRRTANGVHVESRIARPRAHHSVVEVKAVQLSANKVIIDPLRHGPRAGIDRAEPRPERCEPALLRLRGRGRVVRNAVNDARLSQRLKVLMDADEGRVAVWTLAVQRRDQYGRRGGRADRHAETHHPLPSCARCTHWCPPVGPDPDGAPPASRTSASKKRSIFAKASTQDAARLKKCSSPG